MPYQPVESVGGGVCKESLEQLGLHQHRKALLELLDQVEDVISVKESVSDDSGSCLLESCDTVGTDMHLEAKRVETAVVNVPSKSVHSTYGQNFLILEVSETHRNSDSTHGQFPVKVLRLLNELSGQERALHLCDEWFHTIIGPGDTVIVIGEFDKYGKCVIDRESNLVIVHPDILLSGTRVAASFSCARRAVLDERLKSTEHSTSALIGTLLHQIFQAALLKDLPTREFLETYAGVVIKKNIENLYACGVNEKDFYTMLIDVIPRILNWLRCYKVSQDSAPCVEFGTNEQKTVSITEVIDIEEMAWAPRYGLKGMIDASVRVHMVNVDGSSEKIMPLEFKSGKGTSGQSAMEHCAQVILYTLLLSERYQKNDIDSGLIYYLHTDHTKGIKVQRSDLVGLIMRRNELATDVLKASTMQHLPPMLRNPTMCKSCRHLSVCTIYHKANGGDTESSGLDAVFDAHVQHLTAAHLNFLKKWDRLIDLEAKITQDSRKAIWRPQTIKKEQKNNCLSSIILDASNGFSCKTSKDSQFTYHFVHQDLSLDSEMHIGKEGDTLESIKGNLECALKCGDYVVLSTESGRVAVAKGVIIDISRIRVSVSLSRRLRLPGSEPSSEEKDLLQEVWRIDKDEVASSYAIMRFNLIQLFVQTTQSLRLRKMIVDLEAPRFDSGSIFSQDPALSYVQSKKNLNVDQRRAIHKILTAKDYTLILGMPGTGKTSTMVHAVKALLMRGSSILVTSYTNSAVDNLLIKLKAEGIDFMRIGRDEAVHNDIHGHCLSAMGTDNVQDIKQRMETVKVIGVTCLGIYHPLLSNKKFDICIMDEAGQTTLPVSLGPLMLASTFVLVGDHYQLPPLVQSTEARENGMGSSLFCRLSEAHPEAISALQFQYRMCAGIMELSNALIYGNRLRCGSPEVENAKLSFSKEMPVTSWLRKVMDPNKPVVFINTDMLPAPEMKEQKSVNNPTEAYIVSEMAGELVNCGIIVDEIGIITPYNSQANLIRRVVFTAVDIHTIDKYQGRDKECILVSFVRSSENIRACVSSLLGDWHRINVALTRAKKKLIMVGSCRTLSRVPLMKLLIEKVEIQDGILHISKNDIHYWGELRKCPQN
ncbi:hypothetical protein QJS04_geneDACA012087 [Acorus gramineus]|uniref:DNA replication ATP-dependent helicase/nuclease n=1 Tax=Acorus gramineus TaxID=55184 RepID=A0AAV9BCC0_ACOGR|nr:hypothetical protein QJS04_geneDACA012087 [Acorus gramineus]